MLRVRWATYADTLDDVIAAGLRTGDPLPGCDERATMGPLKIISDGSLNTRTAWCCEPYADAHRLEYPAGQPNLSGDELRDLLGARTRRRPRGRHPRDRRRRGRPRRSRRTPTPARSARSSTPRWSAATTYAGWPSSASGPACSRRTCSTTATSPSGSGRAAPSGASRSAGCSTTASSWRSAPTPRSRRSTRGWRSPPRCTAAPTTASPGTASRRSRPREALAASVDGQPTVGVGSPGDLVLLDADPLAAGEDSAATGAALRTMAVALTAVGGRVVHSASLGPSRAGRGPGRPPPAAPRRTGGRRPPASGRTVPPLTQASLPGADVVAGAGLAACRRTWPRR